MVTTRLRKFWWLYLLLVLLGLVYLPGFGSDKLATFMVSFVPLFFVYTFGYMYLWAGSEQNRNLYGSRIFTFDNNHIKAVMGNECKSEMTWSMILKAIERKDCWLLYVAKSQFLYIPKSAFDNDEDRFAFETMLKEHVPD